MPRRWVLQISVTGPKTNWKSWISKCAFGSFWVSRPRDLQYSSSRHYISATISSFALTFLFNRIRIVRRTTFILGPTSSGGSERSKLAKTFPWCSKLFFPAHVTVNQYPVPDLLSWPCTSVIFYFSIGGGNKKYGNKNRAQKSTEIKTKSTEKNPRAFGARCFYTSPILILKNPLRGFFPWGRKIKYGKIISPKKNTEIFRTYK